MEIKSKIAALFLAAAVLLTACSSSAAPQDTTEAENTTAAPETSFSEAAVQTVDENAETGTIKWLVYEDLVTEMADMVSLFESRFGGSVEQTMCGSGSAYFDALGTYIAGGDSPDIVRYEWRSFPHGMSYNMYTPIDSYIDLDSDLWKDVKDVAEQFAYNGKHYYAPNALATNYALNYNNRVLEENGMTDPMTLLADDQWTWTNFEEMLKAWKDMDPVSHIAYNGVGGMSFTLTTGVKVVDIHDGQIINNLKNEDVYRCMQWLEGLRKEGLLGATPDQVANGAISGYVAPEQAFVDGNLLFLGMDPTWAYGAAKQALDEAGIPNEIKFVPFPRDDNSDVYYHGGNTSGFMIPAGAKNIKGALDWIILNRTEEIDPDNIAKAKADALSEGPSYYPKCSNSDCGDTSENADDKGRHIFTDEENDAGTDTCPVCGTPRKERYKVVWTEEQYELWQELKSDTGRFTLLFDNVYGFSDDISNLFIGTGSFLDGPVFDDVSYTNLLETNYSVIESYLQPYRDRMTSGGGSPEDIVETAAEG